MNIYREYAGVLDQKGIQVTPVKNKKPWLDDWQIIDNSEIPDREWNSANGLGLKTGKCSDIICLDIDILETNERLKDLREEILGMLPPVYCALSGNPLKPPARLFKYNGEISKKFINIDVELLCDGNQKVIPPSLHPDTKKPYEWVGKSIYEIDPDDLPILPDGFIDFLLNANNKYKVKDKNSNQIGLSHGDGRCKHGSHNLLSALGVALFHKDYPFTRLVDRLISKDKEINFDSEFYYFNCPSRPWRTKDIKQNAEAFVEEIFMNYGPGGKNEDKVKKDVAKKYETLKDGFHFEIITKDGQFKYIPDYNGLADYLINEKHLKCDDSLVYVWSGKHYKSISFLHLKKIINDLVRESCTVHTINGFYGKSIVKSYVNLSEMGELNGYLNCNNGMLNIKTSELEDHTPDRFIKYVLNHDYNPDAGCPTFLKALDTVTAGDKDLQKLIQQVFGYCIIGGHPKAHKAFMFYGEGGNGKSTILTALANLVGIENTARVPLPLFDKPFSMISLDGKLVNLIDETPKFNINPEAFKNVVSGGYVRAAHKKKDEIDLKVNARILFACNSMPNFKDDSDGMMRRLVIIPFNNKIKEDDIDYNIDDKILSEMSGVLNWAIEGLKDLIGRNYKFINTKANDEAVEQFKQETDSAYLFLKEHLVFLDGPNGDQTFLKSVDCYAAYQEFCKQSGYYAVSIQKFGRKATKFYESTYRDNDIRFDSTERQKYGMGKGVKRFCLDADALKLLNNRNKWI